MENTLTRRNFVAATAAAAGMAAASGAVASTARADEAAIESDLPDWAGPAPEPVTEFDETVDLTGQFLVIGAGMSGYATATRLLELGAKVTLVAKTESWTGIGGSVFAFNSSLAKSLGVEVSSDEALPRVFEMMSHNVDERLWNIFYTRSGEAMDWACGICEEEGLTPLISEVEHGSLGEYVGTHNFAGGPSCSFTTDKDASSTNTLPTTIGSLPRRSRAAIRRPLSRRMRIDTVPSITCCAKAMPSVKLLFWLIIVATSSVELIFPPVMAS